MVNSASLSAAAFSSRFVNLMPSWEVAPQKIIRCREREAEGKGEKRGREGERGEEGRRGREDLAGLEELVLAAVELLSHRGRLLFLGGYADATGLCVAGLRKSTGTYVTASTERERESCADLEPFEPDGLVQDEPHVRGYGPRQLLHLRLGLLLLLLYGLKIRRVGGADLPWIGREELP